MIRFVLKIAAKIPFAAKIAAKTNGKKTITGFGITGIAVVMWFIPGAQEYSIETGLTGLSITAGGLWHKYQKFIKRKEVKD